VAIKIIDEKLQKTSLADVRLIIETLERNRDRIRTLVNMIISTAGFLFSANLAFILLVIDKLVTVSQFAIILFFLALLLLLTTLVTSILASFLKQKYTITSDLKFVDDLLSIYYRELRLMRLSFVFLICGLSILFLVIVIIVNSRINIL